MSWIQVYLELEADQRERKAKQMIAKTIVRFAFVNLLNSDDLH